MVESRKCAPPVGNELTGGLAFKERDGTASDAMGVLYQSQGIRIVVFTVKRLAHVVAKSGDSGCTVGPGQRKHTGRAVGEAPALHCGQMRNVADRIN